MRILIVTDAWLPQVNGVVRTLQKLSDALKRRGVDTVFLTPADFRTFPLPTYREIRVALAWPAKVRRLMAGVGADHVHIATEGPLGFSARRVCVTSGEVFTTSYHTRFPEYVSARLPVPQRWLYAALRRFHNAGQGTLVAAPSFAAELRERGFDRIRQWSRGVDAELFTPERRRPLGLQEPVFLNVGRIAIEKNLEAFLELDLPGTKLVVGDGPDRARLEKAFPDVVFAGARTGVELAELYASAGVFVFPSRTDTFGNVLLEALASGLPVAAFPVTGPLDVITQRVDGVLDDDLGAAALAALGCSRAAARETAQAYSWDACAEQFLDHARQAHGGTFASADTVENPAASTSV